MQKYIHWPTIPAPSSPPLCHNLDTFLTGHEELLLQSAHSVAEVIVVPYPSESLLLHRHR